MTLILPQSKRLNKPLSLKKIFAYISLFLKFDRIH